MEITDGELLRRETRRATLLEVLLIISRQDGQDIKDVEAKVKALLEAL